MTDMKKEDLKMSDRIELNEMELEEVVGGKFTYYEDADGQYKCHVDDVGTFKATYSAKRTITQLYLKNKDKTPAELVQLAISAGVLEPI